MTRKWLGPVLILLAVLATLTVYGRLPDRIPTHWNFQGEVDDTSPRLVGAFLAPMIAAALWILLPVLRRVDPRSRNYERFDETFWLLLNILTAGLLLLHGATIASSLGYAFDMSRAVMFGVGFLFAALGNYFPRLKSNWWMGIRTPWTLESEKVWRQTHRVGGRTFVIGGVLCMLAALLLPSPLAGVVAFPLLVLGALIPVVYSYVVYRQEKQGPRSPPV